MRLVFILLPLILFSANSYAVLNSSKLSPLDGQFVDRFGTSVAVSGDEALISSVRGDGRIADTGVVYQFKYTTAGGWQEQLKLSAADGEFGDYFGNHIAISGNTAVISATGDDDNGNSSGSAYIFVKDNAGIWSQQAKLLPLDGMESDLFGSSVTISGNTAVIGAPGPNWASSTKVGAAYVFIRNASGAWTQQAKIQPSDGLALDYFGSSVSLNGDDLIVGASGSDINELNIGAAYYFRRNADGSWSEEQKLPPLDPNVSMRNAGFGSRVSLHDDTVAISMPGDNTKDTGANELSGSVYIFKRNSAGEWYQQSIIYPPDKNSKGSYFGLAIQLTQNSLIIGAPWERINYTTSGSAFIFKRNLQDEWNTWGKIIVDGSVNEDFGSSIAIDSENLIVGAYDADVKDTGSGAAYAYKLDFSDIDNDKVLDFFDNCPTNSNTVQIDTDKDSVGNVCDDDDDNDGVLDVNDAFPLDSTESLDTDNDGIGDNSDPDHDNDGIPDTIENRFGLDPYDSNDALSDLDGDGFDNLSEFRAETALDDAAHNPGTVASLHYKILPNDGAIWDQFGYSVSIDGDTALIGANRENNDAGAAYIFIRDASGNWLQQSKLRAPEADNSHNFGRSVAIANNYALVGAPFSGDGVVYLFVKDLEGQWLPGISIIPTEYPYSSFGQSVAVFEDTIAIGSSSTTYVFTKDINNAWVQETAIPIPGSSVAIDRNTILIGGADEYKSVYIYEKNTANVWEQQGILTDPNEGNNQFGRSLSVSGNTALVSSISELRTAYVYERDEQGSWGDGQPLIPVGADVNTTFGVSVSISGNTALIGSSSGAYVYVFSKDSQGIWSKQGKLKSESATRYTRYFGSSVSLSGNTALVGSYYDSTIARDAGAAYFFDIDYSDNDDDGIFDFSDNCQLTPNFDQLDSDSDAQGDACDIDDDNDGALDVNDAFPLDASESLDSDNDGIGNNTDPDDDNDFIPDSIESYYGLDPLDYNDAQYDLDGDGFYNITEFRHGTSLSDGDENPETSPVKHFKLFPYDAVQRHEYGFSVAIDADTAFVSAIHDSEQATWAGAVYVYIKNESGLWSLKQKLLAPDGEEYDEFGTSIDISGDVAVIGAARGNKTYIYIKDSSGDWVLNSKFLPTAPSIINYFGQSVSIDGNIVLIGAPGEDAVYVIVRDDQGNWSEQAKITVTDGAYVREFGSSVSISGNTALIGIDDPFNAGCAFVFVQNEDGTWSQQSKLVGLDAQAYDYFGRNVSLSEDVAVVSAAGKDTGAVYVFLRDSQGSWYQDSVLTYDINSYDVTNYGRSVFISGGTLAIGLNLSYQRSGVVVYQRDLSGSWSKRGLLKANDWRGGIGKSISMSGSTLLTGANDYTNGDYSGSAYIFDVNFNDTDNDEIFYFSDNCPLISNTNQVDTDGDLLGDACDLDDDNDGFLDINDAFPLNANEYLDSDSDGYGDNEDSDDDNDNLPDKIEEYYNLNIFDNTDASSDLDGDGYSNLEEYQAGTKINDINDNPGSINLVHQKILSGDASDAENFGYSVDIFNDISVIGTPGDSEAGYGIGAAYIYKKNNDNDWVLAQKLVPDYLLLDYNGNPYSQSFGRDVSISENIIAVSAFIPNHGGLIYIYRKEDTEKWVFETQLKSVNGGTDEDFGFSLDVYSEIVVAGAPGGRYGRSSCAYVFTKNNSGTWYQEARFTPDDTTNADLFGRSVSIYANKILVGAPGDDVLATDAGAAYIFKRNEVGEWLRDTKLFSNDGHINSKFGEVVDLHGDTLLIGSPGFDDESSYYSLGAAYIFERDVTGWHQKTKLKPQAIYSYRGYGIQLAQFHIGYGVALSDTIALVSASTNLNGYRLVNVFSRDSDTGQWVTKGYVTANDTHRLGTSLGLTGATAIIGAPDDNDNGESAGAAYLYDINLADSDTDGILDFSDNCPIITNPTQLDSDGDGEGDACDNDQDGDGVIDDLDAFPLDETESSDADLDGMGDNIDPDADNDGISDVFESENMLDMLDDSDASDDLDGDGFSNLDEYLADTSIHNADDNPETTRLLHQKILGKDVIANDKFGTNVAIDGNTALISTVNKNVVYVYVKNPSDKWVFQAKLKANDGSSYLDKFGASIALSGNVALVGSPEDDDVNDNFLEAYGSVYLFERDSTGAWSQLVKLTASDSSRQAYFGSSVDIQGDLVVIGARMANGNQSRSGAAYIFRKNNQGGWTQERKLLAYDGVSGDNFGNSVAIYNQTLLIGASYGSGNTAGSGAAYVFTKNNLGSWVQEAKLISSDGEGYDSLGYSVAIYENTALISAPNDRGEFKDGRTFNKGSAYIFTRDNHSNWTQSAKLRIETSEANGPIGYSVALSENLLLVSSLKKVLAFTPDMLDSWSIANKLSVPSQPDVDENVLAYSHISIGISRGSSIIGVPWYAENGDLAGAAFIYDGLLSDYDNDGVISIADNCKDDMNQSQNDFDNDGVGDVCDIDSDNDGVNDVHDEMPFDPTESIDTDKDGIGNNADNDDDGDGITDSVEEISSLDPLNAYDALGDIDGDGYSNLDEALAGTSLIDHRVFPGVLELTFSSLLPSVGIIEDYFGWAVKISGNTALVRAEYDDNMINSGAVYVFEKNLEQQWVQQVKLTPDDGAPNDLFGVSTSIDGDTIVIGAPGKDSFGPDTGTVYVFTKDNQGVWEQTGQLFADDAQEYTQFGGSVVISDDSIIIGAPLAYGENGAKSGAVYIFSRDNKGSWVQRQKISANDGADIDLFGAHISLSGDRLAIGSYLSDENGVDSGAVYIYENSESGTWLQQAKLFPPDENSHLYFGQNLIFEGDVLLITSPYSQNGSAVYIYQYNETNGWNIQDTKVVNDFESLFGDIALGLSENLMAIGAMRDDEYAEDAGVAYLYSKDSSNNWELVSKLHSPIPSNGDQFGAVSLSGNSALIGVPGDDQNAFDSGSAYIIDFKFNDLDDDQLVGFYDNCPLVYNPDQLDSDGDIHGDACDQLPYDESEWLDTDQDGAGNNADTDDDGDGSKDIDDPHPLDATIVGEIKNNEIKGSGQITSYFIIFLLMFILLRWLTKTPFMFRGWYKY